MEIEAESIKRSSGTGTTEARAPFVAEWLEANYEVQEGISLPRSTLYNHFNEYCQKEMVERAVFPTLRTRRLGTRGNSKYHYYGIRPKNSDGETLSSLIKSNLPIRTPKEHRKQRAQRSHQSDSNRHSTEDLSQLIIDNCRSIIESSSIPNLTTQLGNFIQSYANHCCCLATLFIAHEFASVEECIRTYWYGIGLETSEMIQSEEFCRIISTTDDILYQWTLNNFFMNILDPMAPSGTQVIRQFARVLEPWLLNSLATIPIAVVRIKVGQARKFSHVLRRRTSLNHLAQATRTNLCNPEQSQQMFQDWSLVDFHGIREQAGWILKAQLCFADLIEVNVKSHLKEGSSIEVWASWLENVLEQFTIAESLMEARLDQIYRTFILKWSFFFSLFMRDLTIRSAASFGSSNYCQLQAHFTCFVFSQMNS